MKTKYLPWLLLAALSLIIEACNKNNNSVPSTSTATITIENVLESKPLVESGTFKNDGAIPVIMPGESISLHFSAAKGQAISFATMYGWSNDLFSHRPTRASRYTWITECL